VIAATILALLALPLLVLRGRTLLAYFATDAATWLFALLLWRRVPELDLHLGFVTLAVLKVATFSLFLAAGRHVRWSANRAALLAAIVYGITIPAMLQAPIDGDEPFYLLVTRSVVRDLDLDLANQYAARAGAEWKRGDLQPQFNDPRGARGEQYSRHEPFLSFLMVPGYFAGGLYGALATIALFGVLLVRSTVRWMEDEGIPDDTARAVFPLFAFGAPVLFYATRIWPEVPAAFFFVEALRGVREQRAKRWIPALLGLVLLKLRFVLVAVGVVAKVAMEQLRRPRVLSSANRQPPIANRYRALVIAGAVILAPLALIWIITGDPTNVHSWQELIPTSPRAYAIGFSGLLLDGMSGIAFQAPFYLLGLIALVRWKETPPGFRTGILASLLYLFYLIPRGEWFGGWAPPLRYIVFLMPVLALGIASVWDRIPRGAIALVSAWTTGLVIHGLAYPWRLFHEFTGENVVGEWLSAHYAADFSRLFPSFIRVNESAWWGVGMLVLLSGAAAFRSPRFSRDRGGLKPTAPLSIVIFALAIALAFHFGLQPAGRIELEDAHVVKDGGKLYPDQYTLMRATYRGGWVLEPGQSLSFLARKGTYSLHFITGLGATFDLAGRSYVVGPDDRYQTIPVTIPREGRVTLRCLSGAINLDRMTRNDD
jgi:hypothetical protein